MPDDQDADAYAVVCSRLDGQWELHLLPTASALDLRAMTEAVSRQPGERGAFALANVADEFFVVVRVQEGRARVLLSDVTAAVEWDLARQALDHLGLEVPGDDDRADVWPAGDLGVFDDLGLEAMAMGAILADVDAYADEMLSAVARRLGFADRFERVVATLLG